MRYVRFLWLGLIALHFIPGFGGFFILEIVFAGVVIGVVSGVMNELGMIPGTKTYEINHRLAQAKQQLEIDRIELTRTRLRARENQEIARVLALEKGKDDD